MTKNILLDAMNDTLYMVNVLHNMIKRAVNAMLSPLCVGFSISALNVNASGLVDVLLALNLALALQRGINFT